VNYEPNALSADPYDSTPLDGAAPKWPVLARVPWIGPAPAAYDERPGLVHSYDWPASGMAEERLPRHASTHRRHRIDSGNVRPVAAPLAMSPNERLQPARVALAARIAQWHAALAPGAGVAMTFVLVVVTGLLYWLAFGSNATKPHVAEAPLWDAQPATSSRLAQGGWTLEAQDLSQFSWPATPMPKAVPARIEPESFQVAIEKSAPAALPADEVPLNTPNSLAESLAEPSDAIEPTAEEAVAPQEPVTAIDPRDYQTTPYATFDFSALQAALAPPPAPGLTPPSIVAEFHSSTDQATPTQR
jgi:hypothetical protein